MDWLFDGVNAIWRCCKTFTLFTAMMYLWDLRKQIFKHPPTPCVMTCNLELRFTFRFKKKPTRKGHKSLILRLFKFKVSYSRERTNLRVAFKEYLWIFWPRWFYLKSKFAGKHNWTIECCNTDTKTKLITQSILNRSEPWLLSKLNLKPL